MSKQFPYQLVTFIDEQPEVGEPVYYGERGWFPQVALKRRFTIEGIDEPELLKILEKYFSQVPPFELKLKEVIKPERMPVHVIEVTANKQLVDFHRSLISSLGKNIVSRFPERDGKGYEPHITIEYGNEFVVDATKYVNRTIPVQSVWLLKDGDTQNSVAHAQFKLASKEA